MQTATDSSTIWQRMLWGTTLTAGVDNAFDRNPPTVLGAFNDKSAKVFQDLKAIGRALGMPTSVLVDGHGCEIATIAGPAEWDSDDAVKLIKAAVSPAAAGL